MSSCCSFLALRDAVRPLLPRGFTGKKKRKKKVVDLHNPCVLWLDQQADLEAASGVGMDVLSAATRSLPAPYRNTVRQEEEAEEAADSAHAATTGPTGKILPASWRLKKAQKKAPQQPKKQKQQKEEGAGSGPVKRAAGGRAAAAAPAGGRQRLGTKKLYIGTFSRDGEEKTRARRADAI